MKTTIIAVRHGYSEANLTQTFTGNTDSPLIEQGFLQAKLSANYLKDFPIDIIYSSDLKRAYDTAVEISKITGLKINKTEKLREIYGGMWEGIPFSEIAVKYPEQYNIWRNDIGKCTLGGGESVKEFFDRIKNAVFDIIKNNEGKTICIATHATPIRVLRTVSLGKTADDLNDIPWCANASISIFEYENGKLNTINYGITEHLGDNVTTIPKTI